MIESRLVRMIDEIKADFGEDTYKGMSNLKAVVSMLGKENIDAGLTRRNLVVSGIILLAIKDKTFYVGGVVLEYTGLCHPCTCMEENLCPGGYNAMCGHGGITARVIKGGVICVGDQVFVARD